MPTHFQLAALAQSMPAQSTSACGLTTQCGLDRALHFLYGAAGILTILLLIVLAAALLYNTRSKNAGPGE